jgi:hypothetical protein
MGDDFTIGKQVLIELLETAAVSSLSRLNPDPDDPGPIGPGGPVIHPGEWAFLNPQPQPST